VSGTTDWSSYDTIAGRYDEVWGSRFEAVARLIWERVSPARGASVLDIGTGTGIVPHALGSRALELSGVTGCDRSAGMIRAARARMPALRLVAADAATLPFRDSAFDVATASFVLSHLQSYETALIEAHRVLRPGGTFAMTSWAADTDAHGDAWRQLLADAVSKDLLQAAVAEVAPSESCFESTAGVESALTRAGFAGVEVHTHLLEYRLYLEQFLADRELSSGGRFARHTLGVDDWGRFVAHAREELGRRFGPLFTFTRGVLIGLGQRAA
jgi:ubiquinone/menaquinone biosynthesis C-methylase UbiE